MANKKIKRTKRFTVISFLLFGFFILPFFHSWANEFFIKLHFCNHTACVIFSLVWLTFSIIGWKYWKDKKKIKKKFITIALVILAVGILLMNMTYCEGGTMHFGGWSQLLQNTKLTGDRDVCKHGVDCPGDSIPVPIPPCLETDSGRDYITPGSILSGVNLEDMCMGDDILRERYCDTRLTYTSEDISCSDYRENYICQEGECIYSAPGITPPVILEDECYQECYDEVYDYCILHTPEDTDEFTYCMASLANDILECEAVCDEELIETDCGDGVDNDGDLLIDCADPDCNYFFELGGCGDFDYSCEHNPTTPYPFCGGTCPTGEICADYSIGTGSWCACMPVGETPCADSTGDGWCEDDYYCVENSGEYYCEFDFGTCYDTDGGDDPLIGGFCQVSYPEFPEWGILNIIEYCLWDKGMENILEEYYCQDGYDMYKSVDCMDVYGLCCIEDPISGSYCGECEY